MPCMYIHCYKLPCDALLCLVCLGPLPTTITDFWRLVWQEKVKVIGEVSGSVSSTGRTRSPRSMFHSLSSLLTSRCLQTTSSEHWMLWWDHAVFTFSLHTHLHSPCPPNSYHCTLSSHKHAEKRRSLRSVFQIHFRAWPDHGVPEYAGPILTFLHRVNTQLTTSKGPLLIHCRYI